MSHPYRVPQPVGAPSFLSKRERIAASLLVGCLVGVPLAVWCGGFAGEAIYAMFVNRLQTEPAVDRLYFAALCTSLVVFLITPFVVGMLAYRALRRTGSRRVGAGVAMGAVAIGSLALAHVWAQMVAKPGPPTWTVGPSPLPSDTAPATVDSAGAP